MKKEDNKLNFPKFKKKIHAFLVGEEGKISKESLIKTGLVLGTIGVAVLPVSSAVDTLSLGNYTPGGSTTATHSSHSSHSSHGSHGSDMGGW